MDGCIAHTSVVRYDAMNELSGQQSSTVALLDERRTGVVISSILHRDQARAVREAGARGQLRVRALAGGAAGGRRGHGRHARRRLTMRVAYLGPAGTHSEEALRASAPAGRRGGSLPHDLRRRHGGPGREPSTARSCRSRTRSRAAWPSRSTRWRSRPTDVRIEAEVVHPIHHCVIARVASSSLADGRAGGLAPAGDRAVRPLPARAPPERRARERAVHRRRRYDGAPARTTRASRSARASRPSCTTATSWPTNVEDHPDNATRFVWLAPGGRGGRAGRRTPKTSIVFWGGGDQSPGWLVDVLHEFAGRGVNLTRIESRPRRTGLGHYIFFVDLEGAAGSRAAWTRRSARCAGTWRSCGYWARTGGPPG